MSITDVLSALQKIEGLGSQRKSKEEILAAICATGHGERLLKRIYRLAFDPYLVYNFTLPKVKGTDVLLTDDGVAISRFLALEDVLLDASVNKIGRVEAKDLTEKILVGLDSFHKKWFTRIVNKDLEIRLGISTFDKFFPGVVTPFGCQLADSYKSGDLDKPYILEPKLDGMRSLFLLDPKNPQVLSRNGKPIFNCDHIVKELLKHYKGCVIDGELLSKKTDDSEDDFAATISAARSSADTGRPLTLWAFDILTLDEFQSGKFTTKQSDRSATLWDTMRGVNPEISRAVGGLYARTEDEIQKRVQTLVLNGFEGAILKDPDAVYAIDRSKAWLKVKPTFDADCVVIGMLEGEGEFEGTMGKIVVRHQNGVETDVGTGFERVLRDSLWTLKDKINGQVMEVQYQNLTPAGKMRFPVFKRFRFDKR